MKTIHIFDNMNGKVFFVVTLLFISMFSLTIVTSAQESPLYKLRTNNAVDKEQTKITVSFEPETKTELNIPNIETSNNGILQTVDWRCEPTVNTPTCRDLGCPTMLPIVCFAFIKMIIIAICDILTINGCC